MLCYVTLRYINGNSEICKSVIVVRIVKSGKMVLTSSLGLDFYLSGCTHLHYSIFKKMSIQTEEN